MRSRIKRRATALAAAGVGLAGVTLATAPASDAATGGGCGGSAAIAACVGVSWGHSINGDAYVAGVVIPPDCNSIKVSLVDLDTQAVVVSELQSCTPGHHVLPSTFEWSGDYATYAEVDEPSQPFIGQWSPDVFV
jgi:hypothetical protein